MRRARDRQAGRRTDRKTDRGMVLEAAYRETESHRQPGLTAPPRAKSTLSITHTGVQSLPLSLPPSLLLTGAAAADKEMTGSYIPHTRNIMIYHYTVMALLQNDT